MTDANSTTAPAGTPRHLRIVVAGAACWWICLGLMAAFTSNPVVVNVAQVTEARLVVEARSGEQPGEIVVLEVLASDQLEPPGEALEVSNLDQVIDTLRGHASCLVPLSPDGDGKWSVQGIRYLDKGRSVSVPVIYPATDSARRRLEQILKVTRKALLELPVRIPGQYAQVSRL